MSVELFRSLAVLAEAPTGDARHLGEAVGLGPLPGPAEYADLFAFNIYPYASVYVGAEGHMGGEARSRVVGFWQAVGLDVPNEPDHVTSLLGLFAALQGQADDCAEPSRQLLLGEAASACLFEHLTPWIGTFLRAIRAHGSSFYTGWSDLTSRALAAELKGRDLPADRLPVHLEDAVALEPPAEVGGGAFLDQLLAPVRTGMVISRQDLARLGRDVGLGVRIGERRYMLEAYLGQDPANTLGWLSRHAQGWTERPDEHLPLIRSFWSERARRSVGILEQAAAQASAFVPGFAAPGPPV